MIQLSISGRIFLKVKVLHITSGDISGASISRSGLEGELLVWHDILYDGPRSPGWPDDQTLSARALFLEQQTGGGLRKEFILETLQSQYAKLSEARKFDSLVLWFDACLFDQSMLCHILTRLHSLGIENTTQLLCIDSFPGIEPYHGIGQLSPEQLASSYHLKQQVTEDQFKFAAKVDEAFALQNRALFEEIASMPEAPLSWVPSAARRWLQELPDESGLGLLERLALEAISSGLQTTSGIYSYVSAKDAPPHFWGDSTLWAKINALADRIPPRVSIEGPMKRLPQWEGKGDLSLFTILPS